VKAGVPRPLEAICLKAMAFRPEERYGTAKELAADVEHWLADERVSVWREPMTVRVGRWTRRRPILAAWLTCSMALYVALLGGTTVSWIISEFGSREAPLLGAYLLLIGFAVASLAVQIAALIGAAVGGLVAVFRQRSKLGKGVSQCAWSGARVGFVTGASLVYVGELLWFYQNGHSTNGPKLSALSYAAIIVAMLGPLVGVLAGRFGHFFGVTPRRRVATGMVAGWLLGSVAAAILAAADFQHASDRKYQEIREQLRERPERDRDRR
jgi:hypothetical protein